MFLANNVVDSATEEGISFCNEAILAKPVCSDDDDTTQLGANVR